jgi:hypothetical protein
MVEQSPMLEVNQCPSWAAALGYMGVAVAVCLSNWGAAVSQVTRRITLITVQTISKSMQRWRRRGTQPTIGSVWISMVISTSLSRSLTGEQIRLDIDKDPLNSTDDQIGSRISPSVTATNEPASHSCSLSTTNITDGNMEVWSEYCAHWYSAS